MDNFTKIEKFVAREVFDSRGVPTIEVSCVLESGVVGVYSVPSGKSTGAHEAVELRDNNPNYHNGNGVTKAISNVNDIVNQNLPKVSFNQSSLDEFLIKFDGTDNKSNLGANAILGVSISFARAFAKEQNKELFYYLGEIAENKTFNLPTPMVNIINGGKHAMNDLDFQEFMFVPIGFESFKQKFDVTLKIVNTLKDFLIKNNHSTLLGDEGGFAPVLKNNKQALSILRDSILKADYDFEQVKISLDVAGSSFYKDNLYKLCLDDEEVKQDHTYLDLTKFYESVVEEYPVFSIEDPFSEDDWNAFVNLNKQKKSEILIVGDDLTVTNHLKIEKAYQESAINAVLIKPNQIGTLSETIKSIKLTQKYNFVPIVSHRSGETMDDFIADLAVGLNCPFVKIGSPLKQERLIKYERLLEIENILNAQ